MSSTAPQERILLIHPGALGDLVQAFPAIARVRGSFPDARIALLTDTGLGRLARDTGLFDEVIGLDSEVAYHGGLRRRLPLLLHLARTVRGWRPTRVGVYKGATVYAALALASGAPLRVGLSRGAGARFLTTPIPIDPARHREDRYFDVSAALGAGAERTAEVRSASASAPLPRGTGPLFGMAPGGARNVKEDMPARRWPSSSYAELAARLLAAHPGARIVLLGGNGDREEADVVRAAIPPAATVDLVGATTIPEARAAIEALDLFVAHDSGLLHVAGTTATPVIAVFGPTDPRVASPRTPNVRVLWNPSHATPCHDEATGRLRPCGPNCCTDRVTVDQVLAAIDEIRAAPGNR